MDHLTHEGAGFATTVDEAVARHHLATADPEVDGTLTGREHEEKYGLERAAAHADNAPPEVAVGFPVDGNADNPPAEQA